MRERYRYIERSRDRLRGKKTERWRGRGKERRRHADWCIAMMMIATQEDRWMYTFSILYEHYLHINYYVPYV